MRDLSMPRQHPTSSWLLLPDDVTQEDFPIDPDVDQDVHQDSPESTVRYIQTVITFSEIYYQSIDMQLPEIPPSVKDCLCQHQQCEPPYLWRQSPSRVRAPGCRARRSAECTTSFANPCCVMIGTVNRRTSRRLGRHVNRSFA